MTDDDLDRHIRAIIAREGGWVDDPDDSGGPTNHGITLANWMAYCRATTGMEGRGDKDTLRWLSALDPWVWGFYRWYFRTQGLAELIEEFEIPDDLVPLVMDMRTLHSPGGCREILRDAADLASMPMFALDRACRALFITFARQRYMMELVDERPKDKEFERGWIRRSLKAIGLYPKAPRKAQTKDVVT